MEDRHNVVRDVARDTHLIGVYDGHGGHAVSDMCAGMFPSLLSVLLPAAYRDVNIPEGRECNAALKDAIRRVDARAAERGVADFCGSTVCMALAQPSRSNLTVANIGDSRMVLKSCGKMFALTKDHNPRHPGERARILRNGGRITTDLLGTERVMGALNMTRSLGDRYLRPHVSPNPVISKYSLQDGDEYIVVATDGLWDVLSNTDVMHIVDAYFRIKGTKPDGAMPHNVARELVNVAIARGSTDNITVVWFSLQTCFTASASRSCGPAPA